MRAESLGRCAAMIVALVLFAACGGDTSEPAVDADGCQPGEICLTVTAGAATGSELRLMLYEADASEWPVKYRSLPTPSWVVTQYPPVPEAYPVHIRIPMENNLFAISQRPIEGARLGLAVATGVASIMVVEPTDARGFSDATLICDTSKPMDFGSISLDLPAGTTCELNRYHPKCLTGPFFWREHFLGPEDFVQGAVYMDVADLDGDGTEDIVAVGEPHFEDPQLPLTVLKLVAYYMGPDLTVRSTEVIDRWTPDDPAFYSPWSVKVLEHAGEPTIVVGTNIPGLAPLEDGFGNVYSYQGGPGAWVRSAVIDNANPDDACPNAMIIVPCDIDNDGDDDIALSGAANTAAVGMWLENRGAAGAPPWAAHLQPDAPAPAPSQRGTLAYKCADLNDDGYPEVIYNGMFNVPGTDPPQYHGEIWLGVNPGPTGWDAPWQKVVIDADNWASADMWLHDFDGDGDADLVANQIFSSTVTLYDHPDDGLSGTWTPRVIISDLTSPSDMWLVDMDGDSLVDVVSADHTAHRGVWHKNPGSDSSALWRTNTIFQHIRMPGDFTMTDLDRDGDLDWLGTSMTRGQVFIVEQVQPDSGLVLTLALPDGFDPATERISKVLVTLANRLPVTGIPVAIVATIPNLDADGDGALDVDAILAPDRDLILALDMADVQPAPVPPGDYYVVVGVYVEGGGDFEPVAGVDYLASSPLVRLGEGLQKVTLEMTHY